MIRGAQRSTIILKTRDSALFEEAHFVVRREACAGDMDLLSEANRIIDGCDATRKHKSEKKLPYAVLALVFSCGFVLGAFLMLALIYFV